MRRRAHQASKQGKLTTQATQAKQQKTTINALIVIDVHAKDVVEKLVQVNV